MTHSTRELGVVDQSFLEELDRMATEMAPVMEGELISDGINPEVGEGRRIALAVLKDDMEQYRHDLDREESEMLC